MYCRSQYCYSPARAKFCGYCKIHWSTLPKNERDRLFEIYQPGKKRELQVVYRYPPSTRLRRMSLICWRMAVTTGMAMLAWKAVR